MTTQVDSFCHGKMDDFQNLNDLNSNKLHFTTEKAGGIQDFVWLTGLPETTRERHFVAICIPSKTDDQIPPPKRNLYQFT